MLAAQRTEGRGCYSICAAELYTRLLRQTCKKEKMNQKHLRELERVLRKASSNCLLIDAKHIFCTLEGGIHIFLTLMNYLFLLTALIDIS